MKIAELLTEGTWIIKNKDGKEKRFRDANSAEAKAWKDSSTPTRKPREPSARDQERRWDAEDRRDAREQARREKEREREEKAEEKKAAARRKKYPSSAAKTPLEKKAKSAMHDVWQAIAHDLRDGGIGGDLDDPEEILDSVGTTDMLMTYGGLSKEEAKEVLGLGDKVLARLVSDFGF